MENSAQATCCAQEGKTPPHAAYGRAGASLPVDWDPAPHFTLILSREVSILLDVQIAMHQRCRNIPIGCLKPPVPWPCPALWRGHMAPGAAGECPGQCEHQALPGGPRRFEAAASY